MHVEFRPLGAHCTAFKRCDLGRYLSKTESAPELPGWVDAQDRWKVLVVASPKLLGPSHRSGAALAEPPQDRWGMLDAPL
jgi:hypothetical protein